MEGLAVLDHVYDFQLGHEKTHWRGHLEWLFNIYKMESQWNMHLVQVDLTLLKV